VDDIAETAMMFVNQAAKYSDRTVRIAGNCVFFRRVKPTLLKFWEPLQLGHSLPQARRNRHPVSSNFWSLRGALVQFACPQVLDRPTLKRIGADKGDGGARRPRDTSASSPRVVRNVRLGAILGPSGVSAPRPLRLRNRNSKGHSTMSQ